MGVVEQILDLDTATVETEFRDAILTVHLHRPEALNALSPQVIEDLRSVFSALREALGTDGTRDPDWSIRGVVLTGSGGKAFAAGADISAMRGMSREQAAAYASSAQELTSWIETLPVPVIAAVNGYALGGGCELAMACDVILASENAVFGQPEVGLGLIPGFGGCVRLQQYVGAARARELIFTGRRIDAEEAMRIGLVARILPDSGALLEAARADIALAAAQSPVAVATAKRVIRAVQALPTDVGLTLEREAFAECFDTEDQAEGAAAFLEKRRPEFLGR